MLVITSAELRVLLAALIDTGAPLETVRLHLFKADLSPTPEMVLADLSTIEADFDGYAAFTPLVWGTIETDASGGAIVPAVSHQFSCTGSTTPQTIYGYWLQVGTGGGAVLVGAERIAAPIPILGVGDGIVAVVMLGLPGPVSATLIPL